MPHASLWTNYTSRSPIESFYGIPARYPHQDASIPIQATDPRARSLWQDNPFEEAFGQDSSLAGDEVPLLAVEPTFSSHAASMEFSSAYPVDLFTDLIDMNFATDDTLHPSHLLPLSANNVASTHTGSGRDKSNASNLQDRRSTSNTASLGGPRSNENVRGVKCYEVMGSLNGVNVNALPDSGSGMDAVSENFAKRHFPDFRSTDTASIRLPGGRQAKSIGRVVGDFKFQGEGRVYRREFHVLRNSMYDLVLGKVFLSLTETLTKHCHRIVEKIRPGVWLGKRLFLLDEPSQDGLPCFVNGAETWALPDTGSDVLAVSASFARRHNFYVHRERMFRNPLRLIDGSTIWTDGMVFDADLQFDLTRTTSSNNSPSFICDIHVIEDLPCDVVLSNEFIFQNQIYSRFAEFFCPASSETSELERSILYLELEKKAFSWKRVKKALSSIRAPPLEQQDVGAALPPQILPQEQQTSWDERLRIEGKRRIHARNVMSRLSGEEVSQHITREQEIQAAWKRNNPRPGFSGHISSSSGTAVSGRGQAPEVVGAGAKT